MRRSLRNVAAGQSVWCLALLCAAVVVAAAAAGPASAGTVKTVDITKKTRFVTEETGVFATEVDKKRCISALFVIWPDVSGATKYTIEVTGFNGSSGDTIMAPPFAHDMFPFTAGAKKHVFEVRGDAHWHNLSWYSTGTGCADAKATVLKSIPSHFKIVKATVTIDSDKAKKDEERKKKEKEKLCPKPVPHENFFAGAPKGAVARVTEVDGPQAAIQHKGGRPRQAKFKNWIFPGDIVLTDQKTVVAFEYITGGRTALNKGTIARVIDGGGRVQTIPSPYTMYPGLARAVFTAKSDLNTLTRIWDKASKRKAPLEIETAGGVMGCKG